MALISYIISHQLQRASTEGSMSKLPTPFQLELVMKLLAGNMMELYHCVKYLFRRKQKQKRVQAVPLLTVTALVLALMLLLAAAVTAVDALFHIKTTTVQYNQLSPFVSDTFKPGRLLPTACWNVTDTELFNACNILSSGSGAAAQFTNSTEGYLTIGNQSMRNTIRLGDDGGTALITPTGFPPRTSFTSQSFASATHCETITNACKPHYNGVGDCDGCQSWAFNCTPEDAGLLWSGNFSEMFLTNSNSSFKIQLQYFNDSAKTGNDSVYNATNGQIWSGVFFSLPAGTDPDMYDKGIQASDMYWDSNMDLVADTYGNIYGILSCNTTLSTITYDTARDGSITNMTMKPMNNSASAPFFQALSGNYGNENLGTGINLAAVTSETGQDMSRQFAGTLDRTILGLTAGVLEEEDAVTIFQQNSNQVAMVPKAEFFALVLLNLMLPVLGLVLGVWAYILCVREGVNDVRARLGIVAMVAGVFEDAGFDATATKVEDLFAEMRGVPTRRVKVRNSGDDGGGSGKILVGVAYEKEED